MQVLCNNKNKCHRVTVWKLKVFALDNEDTCQTLRCRPIPSGLSGTLYWSVRWFNQSLHLGLGLGLGLRLGLGLVEETDRPTLAFFQRLIFKINNYLLK